MRAKHLIYAEIDDAGRTSAQAQSDARQKATLEVLLDCRGLLHALVQEIQDADDDGGDGVAVTLPEGA